MSIIQAELGQSLNPPVKRKANKTGKLRNQAKRVAKNAPEVMVKITGFGKGGGHVKAHLDYISRNGDVELETDRGDILKDKADIKDLFKEWEKDFGDGKRHKNQRDTMHLVLSMPETTDPESVRLAVRSFTKATFGKNHEYVFALHTDEPHPHCHVTVKIKGFDGTRLNPRKADLQAWREGFADAMRDQGVEAEATGRRSRGVVRKAEKQVVRHIKEGDATHKPRESRAEQARNSEAGLEFVKESQGLPIQEKPWEKATAARQRAIRSAWLNAAAELDRPLPVITINNKEQKNERPDYDGLGAGDIERGQRAAALYQRRLEKTRSKASPYPVAGMRNLSACRVVHHEGASKVLLSTNAPDRMGRGGAADPDVRRSGTGDPATPGRAERLNLTEGTTADNKALAERLRAFVASMPEVTTERQGVKLTLARHVHDQRRQIEAGQVAGIEAKKGADKAAPNPVRPGKTEFDR